ncbi:MAG TPA: SpoIIE family protein phosphatase, partial [Capsulimonadaceae bacterium]|nr:SpoIIE family protein phosphatase [Capsulimonadaceae bacterium]
LLYSAATGQVVALDNAGLPLGVDFRTVYSDCPIRLMPGDTLLFYTDGLSEAGPDRSRMLGAEGLRSLFCEVMTAGGDTIEVEVVKRHIIDAVKTHAGGSLSDDACLVIAQRRLPVDS